jgi:polyisoprenoid-binding protein YceI
MELNMKSLVVWMMLAVTLLLAPASASASVWNLDPDHSNIQFKVSHLGLAYVKGTFTKFQATLTFDEKNPAKSSLNVTIDTASIHTGIEKRDEHLRSSDFFDVAKYPSITFVSRKVIPAGKGKLKVMGDLTICGTTKPVVLEVSGPTKALQDPWGKIRVGASATASLKREDFGLTWNKILPGGISVIGNQVTLNLELQFLQAPTGGAS